MNKKIIFLLLMFFANYLAFSFSPPSNPDYEPKGLMFDLDSNYGKTFNGDISIINLKMFIPMFSDTEATKGYLGLSAAFSLDVNIFDLYYNGGFTWYPFIKYFSLTFDFGVGLSSMLLLNHFPYILSMRGNIDIPIYNEHNITIGAGVQHRNAIKMIDYLKFNKNYYGIYNSYFFEIGWRIFIK